MKRENVLHVFTDRDYTINFKIVDEDGEDVDKSAENSKVVRFVVKENVDDTDANAKLHLHSSSGGIAITSWAALNGVITITAANLIHTTFTEGKYYYELIYESTESGVVELDMGILQVTQSVVKSSGSLP